MIWTASRKRSCAANALILRTTVKASPLIARAAFLLATLRRFFRRVDDSFGNDLENRNKIRRNDTRAPICYTSGRYQWLIEMKFSRYSREKALKVILTACRLRENLRFQKLTELKWLEIESIRIPKIRVFHL